MTEGFINTLKEFAINDADFEGITLLDLKSACTGEKNSTVFHQKLFFTKK